MRWTEPKRQRLTYCVATLLAALVISLASPASAQQTRSDPNTPPTPLQEGEPAPFSGDLWTVERSLRLVFRAERCQEKSELDLRHAARGFEIELKYCEDRSDARADADTARIDVLERALDDARPWYREPWFVAIVTSAATVGVVVLTAWVLEQVAKASTLFAAGTP